MGIDFGVPDEIPVHEVSLTPFLKGIPVSFAAGPGHPAGRVVVGPAVCSTIPVSLMPVSLKARMDSDASDLLMNRNGIASL